MGSCRPVRHRLTAEVPEKAPGWAQVTSWQDLGASRAAERLPSYATPSGTAQRARHTGRTTDVTVNAAIALE
jgi:hypothetical protein